MTHTVLTFISKVKPDQTGQLGQLLDEINKDPESNAYIPFRSLSLLHFASLVLHQSPDTPEYGPYLIFEKTSTVNSTTISTNCTLTLLRDSTRSIARAWITPSRALPTARESSTI